jgi:hypothetical protein
MLFDRDPFPRGRDRDHGRIMSPVRPSIAALRRTSPPSRGWWTAVLALARPTTVTAADALAALGTVVSAASPRLKALASGRDQIIVGRGLGDELHTSMNWGGSPQLYEHRRRRAIVDVVPHGPLADPAR